VNEDGSLDLAALPRLGQGAQVWLGDGKGTWRESLSDLIVPFRGGGAFGDVNKIWLLWLTVVRRICIAGRWAQSLESSPPSGSPPIWEIALRDVNGDGLLDLAVSTGTLPVQRQANEPLPRIPVWLNRYPKDSPAPTH